MMPKLASELRRDGRDSRDRRVFPGYAGIVVETARFIGSYIVLSPQTLLVIAAWIVAAWMSDKWDRFPHLAITSPEKRCGKTRTMQIIELITPNPYNTANISPAAIYRIIQKFKGILTLLHDEAQSLVRRGSESSENVREAYNAGIDKKSKIIRCGGEDHDPQEFSIYCPKIVALIGTLDGVLADRCLPVDLRRKVETDQVEKYRSRIVDPIGEKLRDQIQAWAKKHADRVGKVYDGLDTFDIQNDRMAELLLPLQAVLTVDCPNLINELKNYAVTLDERDRRSEQMTPGVLLLTACREIFADVPDDPKNGRFLATADLIKKLVKREEEPWATITRGKTITPPALANLLREYQIRSRRDVRQKSRGFCAADFKDAWERYLPPPAPPSKIPSNPSKPSNSAGAKKRRFK